MKKTNRVAVILYGVCAALWTIRVILDIVNRTYSYSVFSFILSILCAVIWIIAFVVMLKRYLSDKEEHSDK